MKFAHNVGWYVVIIDEVVVAAGCDFNTMINRQEREKAERPQPSRLQDGYVLCQEQKTSCKGLHGKHELVQFVCIIAC